MTCFAVGGRDLEGDDTRSGRWEDRDEVERRLLGETLEGGRVLELLGGPPEVGKADNLPGTLF